MIANEILIAHIEKDFLINELDNANWEKAKEIRIEKCWSGEKAEVGRQAKAKLLWSDAAFYVRFDANQNEPLVVNKTPNLKKKTIGLWDRDVCEIFVAPNLNEPNSYYEFEIAPTGEWLDLKIRQSLKKRETDFDFFSGMRSAARIEKHRIAMAIKIPWKAFGETPRANEVWRGNLFRCIGSGATRGYLAWSPTETKMPNFHVSEAFGDFQFSK